MFINQCFLDYYWLPRRGRTHKQARHLVSVVRSANTGPGNTGVSHAAPLSRGHVSRVTSSLLTQYFSAQYSGQRVTSRELLLICLLELQSNLQYHESIPAPLVFVNRKFFHKIRYPTEMLTPPLQKKQIQCRKI